MLCSACGGNPSDESWRKGPVKLRYTGQAQQPYVAVCERCGSDVDYQPRPSSANRISVLGRLAVGQSNGAGLFHP
jgi:hypothetical protein